MLHTHAILVYNSFPTEASIMYIMSYLGVVGVIHSRFLVHRAIGKKCSVFFMDLCWTSQCVLDDWVLQSTGLPDCYETGGTKSSDDYWMHFCVLPR